MTKKLKEIVLSIIHMKGDPKDIALAFAVGVFVAFFPIFGTHTIMAIGFAWLLGISPAVVLAGTLVNNPWTITLVYGGSLYVGMKIMGQSFNALRIDWMNMTWDRFVELFRVVAMPFALGCIILGILAALASYFLTLKAVHMYRARRRAASHLEG